MEHGPRRLGWLVPVVLGLACVASPAAGASTDWPQWRGPKRTGVSAETGWLTTWPPDGPKVLWRAEVGLGYSSLAVAAGRLYTLGNHSGTDYVYCFDAQSGRPIWKHSYPCREGAHKGPRATPTVDGGRVYTCSREGHVFCLDARTGDVVWAKNAARETGAKVPEWGFAGSPLLEGNAVIVNVGAAGAALDKANGTLVWSTGPQASGYSSPFAFSLDGQRRVAVFAATALVVLNPADGKSLWQFPWKTSYNANAVTPIVSGRMVFISSGYEVGCALVKIGTDKPVWRNRLMRTHFNSCVLLKGYLYGFDETTLKCLSGPTGEVQWSKKRLGKGSLMVADDKLIILGDSGVLAIAEATHEAYRELARAKVIRGLTWTVPVLSGGRIYVRSHPGHLVCLDVRGK